MICQRFFDGSYNKSDIVRNCQLIHIRERKRRQPDFEGSIFHCTVLYKVKKPIFNGKLHFEQTLIFLIIFEKKTSSDKI